MPKLGFRIPRLPFKIPKIVSLKHEIILAFKNCQKRIVQPAKQAAFKRPSFFLMPKLTRPLVNDTKEKF